MDKKYMIDIFTANMVHCEPFETDSKKEFKEKVKELKEAGYRIGRFESTETGVKYLGR